MSPESRGDRPLRAKGSEHGALILGINAYHGDASHGDASPSLFIDGRCAAAAAEERFSRAKLSRDPCAHLYKKVAFAAVNLGSFSSMLRSRLANAAHIFDVRSTLAEALEVDPKSLRAQFHRVEHHRSSPGQRPLLLESGARSPYHSCQAGA